MAGWVLWVTLVLAALAGVACETRYQKFLRQHVDNPRSRVLAPHRYCQTMVLRQ
ncbi:RNL2 Ribonuclease, partial [Vireo altiloquus]|nr:RNL2 Ribonuclease [Vireo altiloquus]